MTDVSGELKTLKERQQKIKKAKKKNETDISLSLGWMSGGLATSIVSLGDMIMGGSVAMVTGVFSMFFTGSGGQYSKITHNDLKKWAIGIGIGVAVSFAGNHLDKTGELGRTITDKIEKFRSSQVVEPQSSSHHSAAVINPVGLDGYKDTLGKDFASAMASKVTSKDGHDLRVVLDRPNPAQPRLMVA